jgi:hypothetical protein
MLQPRPDEERLGGEHRGCVAECALGQGELVRGIRPRATLDDEGGDARRTALVIARPRRA